MIADALSMQRRVVAAYSAALKPLRLNAAQAAILTILCENPNGIDLIQLIERTEMSQSYVTTQVQVLRAKGYCDTRYFTRNKRRHVKIKPTQKTIALRGQIDAALAAADRAAGEVMQENQKGG